MAPTDTIYTFHQNVHGISAPTHAIHVSRHIDHDSMIM